MRYFDLKIKLQEKKFPKNIKVRPTVAAMMEKVQKEYKDNKIDLDQDKIVEAGCLWLTEHLKRNILKS